MAYGVMSYQDMKKQKEDAIAKQKALIDAGRKVGGLNIPVEYKQELLNSQVNGLNQPISYVDRKALNTITPASDNVYDGKGYGLTPNTLENTPSEQPKLGLTKAAQSAPINALQQGIAYQRGSTPNTQTNYYGEDIGKALKRTDSAGISFAPENMPDEPKIGMVKLNVEPTQAEIEQRNKLLKYATTKLKNAQGLTANQMRTAQSLIEEPQKRQAEIAKTQANINAGLQKSALDAQQAQQRQAWDMAKLGLQRQDALNNQARQDALQAKADERYALEKEQQDTLFGLKKQGLEMENEQARIGLNNLQQAQQAKDDFYNAKTPEEQEKAYNRMKQLGLVDKEDKGTFQKTKIMVNDANGMPIEQEVFFNPITGETRSPQGLGLNPQQTNISNVSSLMDANGNINLQRGQVINDREYLGGNPSDPKNWKKV